MQQPNASQSKHGRTTEAVNDLGAMQPRVRVNMQTVYRRYECRYWCSCTGRTSDLNYIDLYYKPATFPFFLSSLLW